MPLKISNSKDIELINILFASVSPHRWQVLKFILLLVFPILVTLSRGEVRFTGSGPADHRGSELAKPFDLLRYYCSCLADTNRRLRVKRKNNHPSSFSLRVSVFFYFTWILNTHFLLRYFSRHFNQNKGTNGSAKYVRKINMIMMWKWANNLRMYQTK